MKTNLSPNESVLIGEIFFHDGKITHNEAVDRIRFLTQQVLEKIASSSDGWELLYIDPSDKRYWELSYQHGELQGGGVPKLTFISKEDVLKKYNLLGKI